VKYATLVVLLLILASTAVGGLLPELDDIDHARLQFENRSLEIENRDLEVRAQTLETKIAGLEEMSERIRNLIEGKSQD
jgi:hypothetical protein